jgi:hypothetical protein
MDSNKGCVLPARIREPSRLQDLQLGIKNFRVEYNAWPIPPGTPTNSDLETEVSGPLLACLLGEKVCGNGRGIRFIEPPLAYKGQRGLVETNDGYQLLDHWGHSYRVIIDLSNDNKVENPDLKNTDAEVREESPNLLLPISVAVMCAGPDGIFHTRDDIVSWRSTPTTYSLPEGWWTKPGSILSLIAFAMILYSMVGLIATRGRA